MSDWSTFQAGGNGAPGYIKVDFVQDGPPEGTPVYNITDQTNSKKDLPSKP